MASSEAEDDPFPTGTGYATGLAIGAGVGVALGTAFGNLALGLAIGMGVGLAMGAAFEQRGEGPPTPGQRRLLVFVLVLGLLVALVIVALALLGG